MQIKICLLLFCASLYVSTSAQTGSKTLQPNIRSNRAILPSAQFNGYDYPAPTNGLRLPQNNFQQQSSFNHNTGFGSQSTINHNNIGPQPSVHNNAPIGGLSQPLKPIQHLKPVQTLKAVQAQKDSHSTQGGHTDGKVQTIKIIHENRLHGSSDSNVKTVRIIHEKSGQGHGSSANHENVQTVKIIRDGGDSHGSYSSGYGDSNVKTVRIVQSDYSSGESLGHSADSYKTIRIVQEGSPAIHSHTIEEARNYQILDAPVAETFVGGNKIEEVQTLQSLHELSPETLHPDSGLKLISDVGSSGYSTSHNLAGNAVTLRVLDNSGASTGYQNAYTTGGDYKTVKILQDSTPIQYAHQQLETVKLVGTPAIPQAHEYKTVRLLPDNQYGATQYSDLGGLDGILKVLQSAGVTTGYGGHGTVKYLRAFKK